MVVVESRNNQSEEYKFFSSLTDLLAFRAGADADLAALVVRSGVTQQRLK